jgi:hypothetical protein
MLAKKVMWLRLSPKEATSPTFCFAMEHLRTVPTKPVACLTNAVSSILMSKGGRLAGAAAEAALTHWKYALAWQGRRAQKWERQAHPKMRLEPSYIQKLFLSPNRSHFRPCQTLPKTSLPRTPQSPDPPPSHASLTVRGGCASAIFPSATPTVTSTFLTTSSVSAQSWKL